MSSDAVHVLNGVSRDRVKALTRLSVQLQTERDGLSRDASSTKKEIEGLATSVESLTKAGELLRLLMDKLVLSETKIIEKVVTEGLKAIFVDQDLSLEVQIGTFRNKIAIDLLIRREQNGIEIVGPPLDTNGGGVSSVASLTLRLLTLLRLKRFPVLFLDETLSAVSEEYIDATGQFLAKLAESSGIPILLVTHKAGFLDHANRAYQGLEDEALDGLWCMKLKQLR